MEAYMAESQLATAPAKLRLPIGAQNQRRMSAADCVLPEMGERATRLTEIASKDHLLFCLVSYRAG
jgi:hypothetical protein